ncbi:MarR family transcriptional regulator [Natrarchaeobius halalkaliphilus]|uniref:MarR family transcriptional regulator n=1 Tax=Natrarchaeobius halalkaliphilus TaxID=1679091 RepID=A0A3N6M0I8_9EURY|nr:helix-turn-helix domain-containing protein [Natrarchaeobius halalkaliphilus]RQG89150.1 MarR family transcriptional regulator [Natrarchaeobius halalkaliphilus]
MMPTNTRSVTVPNDLQSPRAKLVYLALVSAGEATTTELQNRFGLSKLTLLPILRSLVAKGLVRRTERGYHCR